MGNHYHLLVQTPEPNLVAGMKWLQGTYTQRYNGRHRLCGHLFQGRYKAVLVDGKGSSLNGT
jgi:putative transposase